MLMTPLCHKRRSGAPTQRQLLVLPNKPTACFTLIVTDDGWSLNADLIEVPRVPFVKTSQTIRATSPRPQRQTKGQARRRSTLISMPNEKRAAQRKETRRKRQGRSVR